jgi:hypothetical protein
MTVAKPKRSEWATIAAMARPDELPLVPEACRKAIAHNWAVHTDAAVAQNVDKGFHHFITHFR